MRPTSLVITVALLGLGDLSFATAQARSPTPAAPAPGSTAAGPTHVLLAPDAIQWQPIPRDWADGPPPPGFTLGQSEVAILYGDPTREGEPFALRIRSTPGSQLPPHWHPIDENITVLSGVFCVGVGDKLDPSACQDMPAGSFILMPKGMHHFAVAKGDVVQLNGVGPFKIHWVR
ncbi:MAG: hypothetical protein DMF78_15595 [Acidobacteria bacterium]|nr:MAG: hypothetical protein DMF78_15595 [Acidobacteriota bacterium]